jgi:phthiocerol/phenolphthiocerol synthesis type-I polyketide synthase E
MSEDIDTTVEPVAVIGLACRVPGAGSVDEFWENLLGGVESVRFFSRDEQVAIGLPERDIDDPSFVAAAPVLEDVAGFDAALFGMTRREAELRDPQQRLFLELCHTALENAGYDPARYPGDIGVYGGIGADEYQWLYVRRNPAVLAATGNLAVSVANHPDYLATLASYKLNLRGPSLTLHTACSTTLVAFHLACEALRNGECDMALTGGASIELPHGRGYVHADGGILSVDGHTRTFDASASGTVWGSGGGLVVLKRLSDALADGDHIRAVVLGSAVNNDGATKVGFSAPSRDGQASVIAQALGVANVDPRTIGYVEAHGTATALGDPIEVAALTSVFAHASTDTGWCGLGSVKTNVGHLGSAAGITGLIKAVLAVEHGLIPPSLHFERPNPKLGLENSPFYVNATLSKWQPDTGLRRAGVSSFGIGGTNAHVVLEQAPAQSPAPALAPSLGESARPIHLLRVSARTPGALDESAERLAGHLERHPHIDLGDVEHTLRVGRAELGHRCAVVAVDATDAAAALRDRRRRISGAVPTRVPRVAFLFSGQGSQYPGMGDGLYRAYPVFRDAVHECLDSLDGDLAEELARLLLSAPDGDGEANSRLARTALTQPALFMVEYALARLWQSAGLTPAATIGHSIGEYVAATLAGVFDPSDAARLVAARGRLMQSMPAGAMLAVQLDEATLAGRLPDGLSIATVNGPRACVVAGPTPAVDAFAEDLSASRIPGKRLRTSHAFHSPMMEPILAEFRDVVAAVSRRAPQGPFLSNVTGDWITAADATDPSYWARHLRSTVRFGACLATLLADGDWLFVECGPGKQLAGLARMQTPRDAVPPLASLPAPDERRTALEVFHATAGRLWVSGVALEGDVGTRGRRGPLPPYPYERKSYWVEPTAPPASAVAEPVGRRPLDEWFTVPVWRQALPRERAVPDRCLVFADGPVADSVVAGLRAAGTQVVRVVPGPAYARTDDGEFTVRPAERSDYDALLADLAALGGVPARVVHAWALDGTAAGGDPGLAWQAQDRGFFSLLCLTQSAAAAQAAIHVDVLTTGTQDVTGGDATRPEHATVAGIAKVVPLEIPAVTVRHLDVGEDAAGVVDELCREPADRAVALRGGRRWIQDYEPVTVAEPATSVGLREGGIYLVTGGLGGLGITLAEDLARRARARLVLVSRSGLPPRAEWDGHLRLFGTTDRPGRAIAAIRRMEEAGAEVLVSAADVSNEDDLRRVREQVFSTFGRLDGILHTAGVPGGGMIEVKERAAAEAVLLPKVRGTLTLWRVFGDLPLDFVTLFSSVTAVAGGFGQVDYCAANNFLDAYARGNHGWAAPVTSIDWGGWLEVGMAAEVAAPATFRALQRGDRIGPMDHPVLTAQHDSGGEVLPWFSGVVAPDTHWLLDEHRISGVPVVPGTAHLETVRAAFDAAWPGAGDIELRDVAFVEPMAVADGGAAEVRVAFADGVDSVDFQVASVRAGATAVHVRGSAVRLDSEPAPTVDVAAILARCDVAVHDVDPARERSHSGLLTFGDRWRALRRVHIGPDEEIALLDAPPPVAAELDQWVLHPALLDEATSFGRRHGDGQYLPLGYGRIRVRGALPARIYSHLRYRGETHGEIITADLSLHDENGRELVVISDFVLRRVDAAAVTEAVGGGEPGASAAAPAARPEASVSTATGIGPVDGTEAFCRILAADLGPQVIVTAQPLAQVLSGAASLTQQTVADELAGPAAADPGRDVSRDGYVAPRTRLERTLADVWGAVLGVDAVGVEDDFFDLGGNSLVAVQLISEIRKTTGARLPMRSLFESPTVAGMAALAEGLDPAAEPDPEAAAIPRLPRPTAE